MRINIEPPGPKAKAVVDKTTELLSPSIARFYPLVVDWAKDCLVRDIDGNQYIDFNSGLVVNNVGSSHPRVIAAATAQMKQFIHFSYTDFYYSVIVKLAERLRRITPGPFEKQVFYGNSGAEAIEAAFKLVRSHTKRPCMLAFTGAFHGRTLGALSLTASKPSHVRGFSPLVPGVEHTPYPYCYRCPFGKEYPSCDYYCIDYIEEQLFNKHVPADEVAGIFFEPIQGEGGYVVPPDGYFKRLKSKLDPHGILLIDDEVQSGIGRTGRWFAIEHYGIAPDIVCAAKALAGGFPLGAMIARRELMTWSAGSHASTFGGNPVAAAAALATLDIIEKDGLLNNAERQGEYIIKRFREMQEKYAVIGDVRGKGLMIGVELVRDRSTKEPGEEETQQVITQAWKSGVLLITAGRSTLRIAPPLTIRRQMVDEAIDIIEKQIAHVNRARKP